MNTFRKLVEKVKNFFSDLRTDFEESNDYARYPHGVRGMRWGIEDKEEE